MLLRLDALLIDMDGTRADSRARIEHLLRDFAPRHGLDADEVIAMPGAARLLATLPPSA